MKTKKLEKPLKKSIEPTGICKICFKEFKLKRLRYTLSSYHNICDSCYKKFNPAFILHKIAGIKALSIYYYDDDIKNLMYQYKGCFDVELGPLFLEYYLPYLRLYYRGYYIVPIPSYHIDDTIREFNHVEEAFKSLNLPMLKILYKSKQYKQSDQKAKDRHLIKNYLKMSDLGVVKNKKILLVDDIVTTGSTLKAAIELIKGGKPKCIKILTLAMTKEH